MIRGLLFVAAAVLLVAGCSVERRYRVLAFFFDGVPSPHSSHADTTAAKQSPDDSTGGPDSLLLAARARPAESQSTVHAPYAQKQCGACHEGTFGNSLLKPANELCFGCHEDFAALPGFVHGPVASGACGSCHSAHAAGYPSLTLRAGNELCTFCHLHIDTARVEGHKDPLARRCTDCHDPHSSSSSRFLLKETSRSK